jgi:deoxyribodipyrimidine photo-lyase
MKTPLVIYWSRRDFRLADNPALRAATVESKEKNVPFLPLFILEEYMLKAEPGHQFGYPSRWFLARALPAFANQFKKFCLVRGKVVLIFEQLNKKYQLTVFVNDDIFQDFYKQIEKLKKLNIRVQVCEDALSISKETRTQTGNLYSVFTPFKKSVWNEFVDSKPTPKISGLDELNYLSDLEVRAIKNQLKISTPSIEAIFSQKRLIQVADILIDLDEVTSRSSLEGWYMSEAEALERFKYYLKSGDLDQYEKNRNSLELDVEGVTKRGLAYLGKTSKMSLALAWGLVSPRTLVSLVKKHFDESFDNPFSGRVSQGALVFISELIWREFYRYQLFHYPELMEVEFQERFRKTITWVEKEKAKKRFVAWIKGETGYGVVDAAMKQIAETGWMHNRARMVVASILTKNLGVDWRWGQEYFKAALIDLDEASNCGGWQWAASVGADPKPIRIFNPDLQAKNYDASGAYQNKWLQGEGDSLLKSQIIPIVEHKVAREEALRRYGLNK